MLEGEGGWEDFALAHTSVLAKRCRDTQEADDDVELPPSEADDGSSIDEVEHEEVRLTPVFDFIPFLRLESSASYHPRIKTVRLDSWLSFWPSFLSYLIL